MACLSSRPSPHNHLLVGDKNGTLFLLDLAKKIVFSKKEILAGHRVIHIAESLTSDGEVTFSTAAVVLNRHPKVHILRYMHGEQKLVSVFELVLGENANKVEDIGKLPYACQWEDYSRLLFVFTYDGTILLFRIP